MILTGAEVMACRRAGSIQISPFSPAQLNPNSYDYRLGPELIELAPAEPTSLTGEALVEPMAVASRRSFTIGPEGCVLRPGRIYLGRTVETLGSTDHVTTLIGKSSMGRLGLFLQVDACLGHQGVSHRWTLELCVRKPLRVYAGQIVGQVSFWRTEGDPLRYSGVYGVLDDPTPNHALYPGSELSR